jgi:hypothetical protein
MDLKSIIRLIEMGCHVYDVTAGKPFTDGVSELTKRTQKNGTINILLSCQELN